MALRNLGLTIPSLTLLLLLGGASAALSQETAIHPQELGGLRYAPSTASSRVELERLRARFGADVTGPGETRRVSFRFERDAERFRVKGALFSFGGLLLERYSCANPARALSLARHSRAAPTERYLIEVRGPRVLVLSGSALKAPKRALRVLERAWNTPAPGLADLFEIHDGPGDRVSHVAQGVVTSSPSTKARLENFERALRRDASGSTLEVLPDGGLRRTKGELMHWALPNHDSGWLLGKHTTLESQQVLPLLLAWALASSKGSSMRAKLPPTLELSDSRRRFAAKVGDSVRVRLRAGSANYRWTPQPNPGLRLISAPHPLASPRRARVFVFQVLRAGEHSLRLDYVQSGHSTPASKSFLVSILASAHSKGLVSGLTPSPAASGGLEDRP